MQDATTSIGSNSKTKLVRDWLLAYRRQVAFWVETIPFAESTEWHFDSAGSALRHQSGKFFAVRGYRARFPDGHIVDQPLIHQPEVGTQGFLVRRGSDGLELAIQARTEPGNIGGVQIGPTIQATYSNYTAVHHGKRQPFLDHFHRPGRHGAAVLVDTVQPELGSKFFGKWNRNIVIDCPELANFSHPMFLWTSLRSLSQLMQEDHLVNNDARLVFGLLALRMGADLFTPEATELSRLVCASLSSAASLSFNSLSELRAWCHSRRALSTLQVDVVPLADLSDWRISRRCIEQTSGEFFSVIHCRVQASDREVTDWDQPLLAAGHTAEQILLGSDHDGVWQLLLHLAPQIGNEHGAELQPSVSFDNESEPPLPHEIETLLDQDRIIQQSIIEGSGEGGRFFQYRTRYDIRWVDAADHSDLPPDYCWVTLCQIRSLIEQTDLISDELRSITSLFLSSVYAAAEPT